MKIAFIIQDLFQQGAQYVTALMIRGFAAKGYDVDLIVSKVHSDLLEENKIKPFEIPNATNLIVLPDRRARNNVKAIRKYLKHNTPDAIVAMSNNYQVALALAAITLSRGVKKKCVLAYVVHSGLIGLSRNGQKVKPPKWTSKYYWISKILDAPYDVIMGVSEGTSRAMEFVSRLKPNSVRTVYNPVIDNIYWEKLKQPSENSWLTDKKMPTIVAAGAHSSIKNHICLFEAIKEANKKTPVRLVLFGCGQLTGTYRKWIEENNLADRIQLAGHTDNLPAELKNADAFVVSSNMESFSIVLIESLAANVPVISTNCPYGPPELLQNGKYGTLVEVNNPQALADAIIEQITHPRKPAPKESWERFTVENVVNAYEKALGLW